MRKKDEKLKEEILGYARELIQWEGSQALTIRAISNRAGIANGTVYNYFKNKDEILLELTEEFWNETLKDVSSSIISNTLIEHVSELYKYLRIRITASSGMLMEGLYKGKSISLLKEKLTEGIQVALEKDEGINISIWNEDLTPFDFANFILSNILQSLRDKRENIELFLRILRKTLYY